MPFSCAAVGHHRICKTKEETTKKKCIVTLALFMLLTGVFGVFQPLPVSAAPATGAIVNGETYYIRNRATEKYLDIYLDGTAAGSHVQIYDKNYSWLTEQWEFTMVENGDYKIRVKHTADRWLDGRFNCVNGAQVVIYYWENQSEQKWKVTHVGGGYFTLQPRRNTNLYLTASGTANNAKVLVNNYTGSYYQQWYLELKDQANITPTSVSFTAENQTRALSASVFGTSNSVTWGTSDSSVATVSASGLVTAKGSGTANIYAYSVNAPGNTVKRGVCTVSVVLPQTVGLVSSQIYHIRNAYSGQYLDVLHGVGPGVVQYSFNGTEAQQWRIIWMGNGYYTLQSQCASSQRLDVAGAQNMNGVPLGIYAANSSSAQNFKIISVGGGAYALQPQCAPGRALDVDGLNTYDGTIIHLWEYTNTLQQRWIFEPANKIVKTNVDNTVNSNYDRTRAAYYANRFGPDPNTGYDIYVGDNCTNFVSQALYYAYMPMLPSNAVYLVTSKTNIENWFYFSGIPPLGSWKTTTWTSATNFNKHWGQDNMRAYQTVEYANGNEALRDIDFLLWYLKKGDIIQFRYINDSDTFQHSMVICDDDAICHENPHTGSCAGNEGKKEIIYAQNSDDFNDGHLRALLKNRENAFVFTKVKKDS